MSVLRHASFASMKSLACRVVQTALYTGVVREKLTGNFRSCWCMLFERKSLEVFYLFAVVCYVSASPCFLRQWLSNSLCTLVWIRKSKLATLEVADARHSREKAVRSFLPPCLGHYAIHTQYLTNRIVCVLVSVPPRPMAV